MGGLDAAAVAQGLRDEFASGKTKLRKWRLEQLNGLVRLTDERKGEIIAALKQDLNKPVFEIAMAEIYYTQAEAANAAANLSEWMKSEKVSHPMPVLSDAEVRPEPLGAVLVISAWNYPFAVSLVPVVGAIAAGNTVVVKPSELAPATSALIAKLLPLYLDSSAVKVFEGGIPETTALLEQRWDKIMFTGSIRIGKIIMAAAAKHLTPVILELGGKSPAIVDTTTDLDEVAKRISRGKWSCNNGQACVAPDYVLVEVSIASQLVDKLKETLKQFYGEDPSKSPDLTSRVVNDSHWGRLIGLLSDERTADKVVHDGHSNKSNLFIAPTLIMDPPLDSPIMQEEIFGPMLPIITVKNVDEAIKFVNSRPKPLALYLFTNDKKVQERVLEETSSGGVTLNDTMLHAAHTGLPFGGVGDSGMGAYHGKHSFDTFSHKKSILYTDLATSTSDSCPPYNQSVYGSL